MKKRAVILLCIVILFAFLAGCGKDEATPSSEQKNNVVEDSDQGSGQVQISEKTKITDQKALDELTIYIEPFAGLPTFSDIAKIDKAWIVRKYHTEVGFNDGTLYNKYNTDYFSRLSDIEKLAKQNINPEITMSESDDFSSCDGKTQGNPLWVSKEQVFGWFPSGGYLTLEKTYFMEAYEAEGNYLVKAVDLHLSFDEEYFEDTQPHGTIYALTSKSKNPNDLIMVGTFTLDKETNSAKYSFTKELSSLKQYWYTVGERSSGGFRLMAKKTANSPDTQDDTPKASDIKEVPNSEAAIKLVHELIYDNNTDIGFTDFGKVVHNGVECYSIKSFSKEMRAGGGSGTIEILYVEINTGKIWSGDTEITPGN